MTKIKICGISDLKTAKAIDAMGVDYIGFVFTKSRRRISPEEAKKISEELSSNIKRVGVFTNEKEEEIMDIANFIPLDYVQLHGNDTYEGSCIDKRIIKSLSIDIYENENLKIDLENYKSMYDHVLFDTKIGDIEGGSGIQFNWKLLDGINLSKEKCFLAGGLSLNNIEYAIKVLKPYAVDISSGLETNGKKDLEKIRQFIYKVRSVEHEL